ncbi:MAG: PQQ-binding-like beta-propeller repeat protein, partial [bacterium]
MNTKYCVVVIVLAAIAHGGSASDQEPFRRVLLEAAVPIGEEAPPIAVQGNLVAFGAGHEIKVFDVRRQEMIFTQSLVPGALSPSLAYESRVLGLFSNTVYACVRHFADPDRLDPGGKAGAVGCGGGDPGEFEVVAVRIGAKEIRSIAHLGAETTLAEGLLGTALPFVEGDSLRLLSLETGALRTMTLPGPAVNRPVVKDGELVGRYEGGVYMLSTNEATPRLLSFANTPLAQLAEDAPFAKCGDLLVGFVENQVVACGLDGRLRWRTPILAGEITGSREQVLILRPGVEEWPTLCRLDPQNGALTWRRPVSPRVNLSGNNCLYGVEVFGGRIVFFNECEISVFDCATGRFLVNLPQQRPLVRKSYPMTAKLVRMAISGNRLAIGFENAVVAVDITPTSDVGVAFRGSDPANARREVEALVEAESKASDTIEQIAVIGHNLADTPEIAPVIRSW